MRKYNSHTSALFHYTRKQNVLINILKEGLKFSYCKEKFSDGLCIGIPMISFCDIQISNSFEHSSKYGQYAIALSKDNLIKIYMGALGPVNYFTNLSTVRAAFELMIESEDKKKKLKDLSESDTSKETRMEINGKIVNGKSLPPEHIENAMQLLSQSIDYHHYSTQAIGFMKAYQSNHNGKKQVNYDECEWRIVLPENAKMKEGKCKWFWTEMEYDNWRSGRNDKFINELMLRFSVDDIEYIIVPNKNVVPSFIKRLIGLNMICGKELTDKDRYSLVSKVISLEQIKRDF